MVHEVILFIVDPNFGHFGLAIECQDGWYKFEYAADGGKSVASPAVTVKRSAPTGEQHYIGDSGKGLNAIIEFAR